jgi:hypothetical protein
VVLWWVIHDPKNKGRKKSEPTLYLHQSDGIGVYAEKAGARQIVGQGPRFCHMDSICRVYNQQRLNLCGACVVGNEGHVASHGGSRGAPFAESFCSAKSSHVSRGFLLFKVLPHGLMLLLSGLSICQAFLLGKELSCMPVVPTRQKRAMCQNLVQFDLL